MIAAPNYSAHRGQAHPLLIKVVGVGSSGIHVIDQITFDPQSTVELVACHTDVQILSASRAEHKVQMGRHSARGLGVGGDPELGYSAAEEAADEIRAALDGTPLVLICAGLGGGTGSGATPLITRIAREQGSLVVVCATLPFSFEGKKRGWQAHESLAMVQQYADAVLCFENDRMGELIPNDAGLEAAFAGADRVIAQAVRSITSLVNRTGLIRMGFDDVLTALRNTDSRCLFGYGESDGAQRAQEALDLALRSPLIDQGTLLSEARNILVQVVGGNDLTLSEVQALMEDLNRFVPDQTQILFGATLDPEMEGRVGVTLMSSISARGNPLFLHAQAPHGAHVHQQAVPVGRVVQSSPYTNQPSFDRAYNTIPHNIPVSNPFSANRFGGRSGEYSAGAQGGEFRQAIVVQSAESNPEISGTHGRFENSEPTIVNGEDLDVPTFMRKNMKVGTRR